MLCIVFNLISFLLQKTHYLTLNSDSIIKGGILKKSIHFKDIIKIEKNKDCFHICTKQKTLSINIDLLEDKALKFLDDTLGRLQLKA